MDISNWMTVFFLAFGVIFVSILTYKKYSSGAVLSFSVCIFIFCVLLIAGPRLIEVNATTFLSIKLAAQQASEDAAKIKSDLSVARKSVEEIESVKREADVLKAEAVALKDKLEGLSLNVVATIEENNKQRKQINESAERVKCMANEVPLVVKVGAISAEIDRIKRVMEVGPINNDVDSVLKERLEINEREKKETIKMIRCLSLASFDVGPITH